MIDFFKDCYSLLRIYMLKPDAEMARSELLNIFKLTTPILFLLTGFQMCGCTVQTSDGGYRRLLVVSKKALIRGDTVQLYGVGRDGYAFAREDCRE